MNKIIFVGKTNAGKSSLINALIKERICVVGDLENLTSDVVKIQYNGSTLIDTPGLNTIENVKFIIERVDKADTVVIVLDPRDDFTLEKKILHYFRDKPCIIAVNKADLNLEINDLNLPSAEIFHISSINKLNIDKLRQRLGIASKPRGVAQNRSWSIFGKTNVGKSTLANALMGYDRFKTEDARGTTRDIGKENIKIMNQSIELVDTPGYIKNNNTSITRAIQYRLQDHVNESEYHDKSIGIMVISAVDGITMSDRHLMNKLLERFFVIIVLNKADLVDNDRIAELKAQLKESYKNIDVVSASSLNKKGLKNLILKIKGVEDAMRLVIKTSEINKWLRSQIGVECIKYATQTGPFTFKLFSKRHLQGSRVRQLQNAFAEHMNLRGVKIDFDIVVN